MQNVIFIDINEVKGIKKQSNGISAAIKLIAPHNGNEPISGTLIFNEENNQYEASSTWKFQYGNYQLCSLLISLCQGIDTFARVKLPLKWFQRNAIVTMQFPMKPCGFDGDIFITVSVHLSENHAAAFDAPYGNLTVKPTWKITSALVNGNKQNIYGNDDLNITQEQENNSVQQEEIQQQEIQQEEQTIDVQQENEEESTDDESEDDGVNVQIPMYYPEDNKCQSNGQPQFNPSIQGVVVQRQEFNLQQVYQVQKPQYYQPPPQQYYQPPPQQCYQQPIQQYYQPPQQYYQQPIQQYYQPPLQQYYQQPQRQYYQPPPQQCYQQPLQQSYQQQARQSYQQQARQYSRPKPTSGLVKTSKVNKKVNVLQQKKEHVNIPPPVNNTSNEPLKGAKQTPKPKDKGKMIEEYNDIDISLGVPSINTPDSSAINNNQPDELKDECLEELDVHAESSKKSNQKKETTEKLLKSEEHGSDTFLPQYPDE